MSGGKAFAISLNSSSWDLGAGEAKAVSMPKAGAKLPCTPLSLLSCGYTQLNMDLGGHCGSVFLVQGKQPSCLAASQACCEKAAFLLATACRVGFNCMPCGPHSLCMLFFFLHAHIINC